MTRRTQSATRKLDIAVIAGALLAGILLAPESATASPGTELTVKETVIGAPTLGALTRRSDEVRADSEVQLRSRIDSHLDKAAKAGRLFDAREVKIAAVPDPTLAGEEIHLVWDEGRMPQQITVADVTKGKHSYRGYGSIFVDEASVSSAQPAGGGYEFGAGHNMYRQKYGFIEQFWNDSSGWRSPASHYLWAGWEKWAEAGTDHWVYNRWGRFTKANDSPPFYTKYVREVTLRSRPWAGSDAVRQLNAATPTQSATSCEEIASYTIGYGYGGGNAAVTVPMHRCSQVYPVGVWSRKEIGVQFMGYSLNKVMYVDMAGDYSAKDRYVVPVWADYAWVGTQDCVDGPGGEQCELNQYSRRDSGW
jgi:hypothetical protein